ncbi:cation:proton antiporter [Nakamurella sp.]|uniref:cation:proton antiporter domain-containing protein n=1 Tax=Nakamurella sp. TaxID=1869182 RepID=UPI003B3BA28C
MPALVTAVFGLVVVGYAAAAHRLDRWHVTAPMVFTAVGTVIGIRFWDGTDTAIVHGIAEITLALVLFHDAAQVRPRQIRSEAGPCARLLLIGLPLTIALGVAAGMLLLPGTDIWLVLLLAAALAPTDAGLGAPTVLNPVVPVRIRRILNVESGLNDGLATPIVLFAIAAAAGAGHGPAGVGGAVGAALIELAGGVLAGVLIGGGCGRLLAWADRQARLATELLTVATVAIPVAAYYGSIAGHANGFVAAFVAGTAFAAAFTRPTARRPVVAPDAADEPLRLTEWVSTALGYAVWALFGVIGVAQLFLGLSWAGVVFAVLSLTVLRMLPVAIALLGSRFAARTTVFLGWFGPRGLASVIFALIAVEELAMTPELRTILGAITLTVLLSVVLHGMTAAPWAQRYGDWALRRRPPEELRASAAPSGGRAAPHARPRGGD